MYSDLKIAMRPNNEQMEREHPKEEGEEDIGEGVVETVSLSCDF